MGSTGPASINPATGKPYGLDFPVITIDDMVRAQARLIDHLGIPDLFCVIGGSMGGMQVLEWCASFGDRVFSAVPVATAPRHSSQNIAFHEVGRQAVMADPDWRGGRYLEEGTNPAKGLAVARMAAHITYLSDEALHRKFGRNLQNREKVTFGFDADFQVESYLRYQGISFVDRFDANSYLYITRAMDYFDLAADQRRRAGQRFRGHEDALLRRLVHQRLALSHARKPRHRAGAERRGGECQLRRNRKRQGARRLPAARAGAVRHGPRLSERGGATARPARGSARRQPMTALKELCQRSRTRARRQLAATPRIDLLADRGAWSSRARACSMWAAATASF